MLFHVRCPVCQSFSVRLTVPTSPEAQSFCCNVCGCAWSVTGIARTTAASTSTFDERPPLTCPSCQSPNVAIAAEAPNGTSYRCRACGNLFVLERKAPTPG